MPGEGYGLPTSQYYLCMSSVPATRRLRRMQHKHNVLTEERRSRPYITDANVAGQLQQQAGAS